MNKKSEKIRKIIVFCLWLLGGYYSFSRILPGGYVLLGFDGPIEWEIDDSKWLSAIIGFFVGWVGLIITFGFHWVINWIFRKIISKITGMVESEIRSEGKDSDDLRTITHRYRWR